MGSKQNAYGAYTNLRPGLLGEGSYVKIGVHATVDGDHHVGVVLVFLFLFFRFRFRVGSEERDLLAIGRPGKILHPALSFG